MPRASAKGATGPDTYAMTPARSSHAPPPGPVGEHHAYRELRSEDVRTAA